MHKHDVACFDCRIAAYTAHCDADVRTHKHGSVVYAVAYKAKHFAFLFVCKHLLDVLNLVLRKQRRFVTRKSDLACNVRSNSLVIAREHNSLAAHFVEFADGGYRFVLDLVAYEQRSDKLVVVRNINDRADTLVLYKRDIVGLHKFFVAAIYNVVAFCCKHAESRNVCERISALDFTVITRND